ncbi:MAG: J domain-containing protein [Clostridia bacterium]|nr:J domain-containing protein [Clostridia bacterium]MBQ1555116.1 J domain-containing protein [Clostridia bacterium]MBQ4397631.1 J domain-containing protein [Clostridia bacterium]
MTDPYAVLGVSPSATDEEIKTAFRALAKKYHPDNYASAPDVAELAAEKMTEINQAYDEIINARKNGRPVGSSSDNASASGSYGSAGGYTGAGTYSGTQHTDFADVRNLLAAGRITDAEQLLDGVPVSRRNAEWYFLKGTVLYRRGWVDQAYAYFETAVNASPNNTEYRAAYTQVSQQRSGKSAGYQYRPKQSNASCASGCGPCSTCVGLLCADSCCECFGGDLITCC